MAALAEMVGDTLLETANRNRLALCLRLAEGRLLPFLRVALEFREHGFKNFVPAQRSAPDFCINIFRLADMQLLRDAFDGLLGHLEAFVGEHLLQNLTAELHVLIALRMTQEAADFRARAARDHELLPQR